MEWNRIKQKGIAQNTIEEIRVKWNRIVQNRKEKW